MSVKTVTKQEVIRRFDAIGTLAHTGGTVLVTQNGEPWIKLVSAGKPRRVKSNAVFKARLSRISVKPVADVSEVLDRLRG